MLSPQFLIGIDLGTTNTVVAYVDISMGLKDVQPKIFEIEQLVAPGEVAKRPMLASFRYHPMQGELPENDMLLPWSKPKLAGELDGVVIGEWARELGSKVEGRLVSSAKSWLSHPQVDRVASILPWSSVEGVEKVSPVLASASYLNHVKNAWNHENPLYPLEAQEVVITVPASFDEAARALTLEAASMAGIDKVLLLEEPQAVCYDWYAQHKHNANALFDNVKLLMVCDVGGGTTDLSLIQVKLVNGDLSLTRIGVGDHLMLGGDNVDLALAHMAEKRIVNGGKALNAASLSQLVQQTRKAKELLLSKNAPTVAKVTVLGGGARLIGGARSCELSREEVLAVALDGFFPLCEFSDLPSKRRSAIVEFGLPYASDPAVTKHIAEFLHRHQLACRQALNMNDDPLSPAIPDALLFNGGVFNSGIISERAVSIFSHWRGGKLTQLNNIHPDLAVANGAVAYGLARRGALLKIGGGAARSYFLQIEGKGRVNQALCLLAKGTEEGIEVALTDRHFLLRLGQPVQFNLLSTSSDTHYAEGELCDVGSDDFILLPPLVAALETEAEYKNEVEVQLVTSLTEVGTLHLECVSAETNLQRWNVEFEIRKNINTQRSASREHEQCLPSGFDEARNKITEVFGSGKKEIDPRVVKRLRNDLEKILGKRDSWDGALLRAIFDVLMAGFKRRRRSMVHERVWFNLAGYTLRPGRGLALDEWRIQQVWPLYEQGLQFPKESQSWSDWWTFWRRAAGGLNELQQQRIFKDISAYINPATARNLKSAADKNKAYEDMLRLVAVLENLPVTVKEQVAEWLVKRLKKASETPTSWWALGRVASRVPIYGSAHNVLDKSVVSAWLPLLLEVDWRKNQNTAFSAVMLARMSGDRIRDLDDKDRDVIIEKLQTSKAPATWIEMVSEVKELDAQESKRMFGESLPVGLKLVG